jgi:hypothetical protein
MKTHKKFKFEYFLLLNLTFYILSCTASKLESQSNLKSESCQPGFVLTNGQCIETETEPTPTPSQSCIFQGNTILSGQSTTAYNQSTVPNGQSCVSEVRNCVNGNLSGSFSYSSCSVLPPASYKQAFVATGAFGRTLISCNDGVSWIKDRTDNSVDRCYTAPTNIDCDHSSGAARGVDIFKGNIYANFGWGAPGSLRKSTDGVNWTNVRSGGSGGGVGSINDRLMLIWGSDWHITENEGNTWNIINDSWSLDHPHMSKLKNRLAIISRTQTVVFTEDGGLTFYTPSGFNMGWVEWSERRPDGGMAEGNNNVIVAIGNSGGGRSTDGGRTWNSIPITGATNLIHTGTEFIAWSPGQRHRSTDGLTWTSTNTSSDIL